MFSKTNLFSSRNFLPPKYYSMSVASLWFVIDHSPLLDFYRRQIWANVSFLFTSQQSSSFFQPGWGQSQRSLSNFLSDSFPFLRKFAYVCPLLAKTVCKTLLTSHSGWTLDSDHVRRSHHSKTSIVRLYSNHKLRSTNHNRSLYKCP